MGKRQLTGAALTAKLIKQRLTALYPRVKFSVTNDNFSMGNSVRISWTDGPNQRTIDAIAKQYQYGSFDGMTDSYNYEAIDPALGCEGAKYVSCSRDISAGHKAMLHAKIVEIYGEISANDHSYYRRLNEVEQEFFPYPKALPGKHSRRVAGVVGGQRGGGNTIISGLEYEVIKDVDTRDSSELFVVKIITRVDDFSSLRQEMDAFGGYYSRFKRGFIFRQDPTALLAGDDSSETGEEKVA